MSFSRIPMVWQRLSFLALALLMFAPTYIHYRFVDHRLALVREPWGLIPTHFLFLRALASMSTGLGISLIGAFAWSFRRSDTTPRLLTAASLVFGGFITAYACYALFIVAVLLSYRSW